MPRGTRCRATQGRLCVRSSDSMAANGVMLPSTIQSRNSTLSSNRLPDLLATRSGTRTEMSSLARRTPSFSGCGTTSSTFQHATYSLSPILNPVRRLPTFRSARRARWLVGFWLNRGASRPRTGPSAWMRDGIRPGSFWGERVRKTIATQVDRIRHWRAFNCSYEELPFSSEATWFVDPPYQNQGKHYYHGPEGVEFSALGDWCRTRPGQIIVCENEGADWLPFTSVADVKTTRSNSRSVEVVWIGGEKQAAEGRSGRTRGSAG